MFLMLAIMLPAFLLAMYEQDGLPFEKVIRNIIRAKFTCARHPPVPNGKYLCPICAKGGAY